MTSSGAPALSPTMASRKLQALAFIEHYFAQHGTGPSLGEITAALDCHFNRARDAVDKLHREGRIHRTPGVARSIRPLSADEESVRRAREAGYLVIKAGIGALPLLDHDPGEHGEAQDPKDQGPPPRSGHGPEAPHPA